MAPRSPDLPLHDFFLSGLFYSKAKSLRYYSVLINKNVWINPALGLNFNIGNYISRVHRNMSQQWANVPNISKWKVASKTVKGIRLMPTGSHHLVLYSNPILYPVHGLHRPALCGTSLSVDRPSMRHHSLLRDYWLLTDGDGSNQCRFDTSLLLTG